MEGKVLSINCGMYSVLSNGVIYNSTARGLFRKNNEKVMVGDDVILDDTYFTINLVKERKSRLVRPAIANIDQIFVVLSLAEPEFSYLLAYKYLTYANKNGVTSSLILTKTDKYTDSNKINEIKRVFEKSGVSTYFVSSKNKEGLDEIKKLFANKITCLMGQSGVGKSSLINAIDPNYKREVGEYSFALGRGKHKTKEVILLPYMGGFLADTPGFSSLELDMSKEELAKYFPGFLTDALKCFYSNCLHQNENKCKIKEKLSNGEIDPISYDCYLKLLNDTDRRF